MLTPVELQNLPLKAGMGGYKKKDVDELLEEICRDYETLYKENVELKDKVSVLSEGLQYYKEMEKTLQKTLVVAEKTAEEVEHTAKAKADLIQEKALAEAAYIIEDAKRQAQQIHNQTLALVQQYENYRVQYKRLAQAQSELMDSPAYQIHFDTQTPSFIMEEPKKPEMPRASTTTNSTTTIETEPVICEEDGLEEKPVLNEELLSEEEALMKEEVKQAIKNVLASTRKLDLPLHSLKLKEDEDNTSLNSTGNFEFFENKED